MKRSSKSNMVYTSQLCSDVCEQTGMSKRAVTSVVSEMVSAIARHLEDGDEVNMNKFGVFKLVQRKAKLTNDVRGDIAPIYTPPLLIPKFTPSYALRERFYKLSLPLLADMPDGSRIGARLQRIINMAQR